MPARSARMLSLPLLILSLLAGCQSPYYADQGALAGGVTGAGVGALIGSATHHTGAGALIGTGVGALTGGMIGSGLDQIDAKNRAQIAATLGRPLPPGGVTVNDVVSMTKCGVNEDLIVNHIRANGLARPLAANELITLQQEGVSTRVVATMQGATVPAARPVVVAPGPVMANPYFYPPPPPPPPYWGGYGYYPY
jgi:surface antigen